MPFAKLPEVVIHCTVMIQMASLTESSQVAESVIINIPVQVCYRQDYFASGHRVQLIVYSLTPLTPVVGTFEADQPTNQAPFRVV